MEIFRQGDVLFVEKQNSPLGEVNPLPPSNERGRLEVVTARGEVTGHAHVFTPEHVTMFDSGDYEWVEVKKQEALRHEEHGEVVFPKGNFEIVRPYNYTPERIIPDKD